MKLQQAFIAETSEYAGNWVKIGYTAPGTKAENGSYSTSVFTYTDAGTYNEDNNRQAKLSSTEIDGFQAKSTPKLNDCGAGSTWTVTVKAAGDEGTGEAEFAAAAKGGAECEALTPTFANIGK